MSQKIVGEGDEPPPDPASPGCLDDDVVTAYLADALSKPERERVVGHLDACPACRGLVSDLALGASVSDADPRFAATVRPDVLPARPEEALPLITAGGDIEVRAVLGEGGMGQVVLARQRSLDREVALKSLPPHRRTPAAEAALLAEGRIAGGLEHPNIVPVHAVGRGDDGAVVLVMKHVEGATWRERMRAEGLDRNLEILVQVCNAAHFAHTRGVLHRDIKPANVMLSGFGEVTIVDWGVALRLDAREAATELAGTPAYMAPEMLRGGAALSPRTDVYLLGATLHEVLTGAPPHRGRTLEAVLGSVASPEAPRLDDVAPEALAAICRKALDPDPSRRFESAAALRDALEGFRLHRASNRLAAQAMARLDEARRAGDPATRRRLLVECQFGLREALREWADNGDARRGLAGCLAELARLEVAEGNRGAAERLVEELGEAPADVAEALAALRARQGADEAARERLAAIEHDQDLGVSRRARVAFAACFAGANALSIAYAVATGAAPATPAAMARESSVVLLVLCAAVALARRSLLRNRVNRQVILSVVAAGGAVVLHEALAAWRHQSVEETLAEAMVLVGLSMALMALLLVRWLAWVAAFALAASVLATVRPRATFLLWAAVTSLPWLGMMAVWWRPPRKP